MRKCTPPKTTSEIAANCKKTEPKPRFCMKLGHNTEKNPRSKAKGKKSQKEKEEEEEDEEDDDDEEENDDDDDEEEEEEEDEEEEDEDENEEGCTLVLTPKGKGLSIDIKCPPKKAKMKPRSRKAIPKKNNSKRKCARKENDDDVEELPTPKRKRQLNKKSATPKKPARRRPVKKPEKKPQPMSKAKTIEKENAKQKELFKRNMKAMVKGQKPVRPCKEPVRPCKKTVLKPQYMSKAKNILRYGRDAYDQRDHKGKRGTPKGKRSCISPKKPQNKSPASRQTLMARSVCCRREAAKSNTLANKRQMRTGVNQRQPAKANQNVRLVGSRGASSKLQSAHFLDHMKQVCSVFGLV